MIQDIYPKKFNNSFKPEAKASDDESRHFKEVDKRIMKEQLFAQPDFGRDELMRLFGVDKNTLPSIIQRFTGTNVPGYINNKRMEYAVLLIKQHPEYTLGAISEACGINTYNRISLSCEGACYVCGIITDDTCSTSG